MRGKTGGMRASANRRTLTPSSPHQYGTGEFRSSFYKMSPKCVFWGGFLHTSILLSELLRTTFWEAVLFFLETQYCRAANVQKSAFVPGYQPTPSQHPGTPHLQTRDQGPAPGAVLAFSSRVGRRQPSSESLALEGRPLTSQEHSTFGFSPMVECNPCCWVSLISAAW